MLIETQFILYFYNSTIIALNLDAYLTKSDIIETMQYYISLEK